MIWSNKVYLININLDIREYLLNIYNELFLVI
jgi:hypothetical protein